MKNSSKSDDIIIKLYDIYIYINYIYIWNICTRKKKCWIHHDWIPAVYEDVPSSMKTELFLSYENPPGIMLFTLKKSITIQDYTHIYLRHIQFHHWLVVEPPLWKIWVRQLVRIIFPFPTVSGKSFIKAMFQSTNQTNSGTLW
jgi:hypothetical protein